MGRKILHLVDNFMNKNQLVAHPVILMSGDVFGSVTDYDKFLGFKRYVDNSLPEGHIRIVGKVKHGEVRVLHRVCQ